MSRAPSVLGVALLAVALVSGGPARAAELTPISLESLSGRLDTRVPHTLGPRGLELVVDGNQAVFLPLQAQLLELDVEATGPILLTWASQTPGRQPRPFGPPWRHLTIPRSRSTVSLDQRITDGWTPSAQPILVLTGAGSVIVHGLRVLPLERDPGAAAAAYDRALLWAPEGLGHTTINLLTPSYWSAPSYWNASALPLSDVVAGIAAVAFAAVVAISWRRRGRPGVARGLAAGALVAAGLWNVHTLARFLPAFHLRPTFDVEERIRDHYDFAPDVGALAALARATIRPEEKVGATSVPKGWFAPQTLCFNLFPRRCVILSNGAAGPEHAGIMGVGTLRESELDAVIDYRAPALPPAFAPVAGFGTTAVIARRRP
jgi:hypothetical protein